MINDLNVSIYGERGRLYDQSLFSNIYSIIDGFDAKLNSGLKVNDSKAELTAAMEKLGERTTDILGH